MAVERTLSIVKPDAVVKNIIGKIYSRFEEKGLKIVAVRMLHLSRKQAEGFYAVHRGRPFFNDLVEFMTSGPVMVQVLEGDNAIQVNRELMGAYVNGRLYNFAAWLTAIVVSALSILLIVVTLFPSLLSRSG